MRWACEAIPSFDTLCVVMADMEILKTTGSVALAEGIGFPRRARVKVTGEPDDANTPFAATAQLRFQGGRLEVVRLAVDQVPGGPPVTGEALRTLPRAIVREVARRTATGDLPMDLRSIASQGLSDEALQLTALVYRFAFVIGDPPAWAVHKRLGIPRSTAGRWIGLARERGYLGPPQPGRAGEHLEEG
jgi:hypothetical protein